MINEAIARQTAIEYAAMRPGSTPFPRVYKVEVVPEDFSGELLHYLTVDVTYDAPCRALYGFHPMPCGGAECHLWMD